MHTKKKGYRCYDPLENKTYVSRDVSFHENTKFYGDETSLQGESVGEVKSHDGVFEFNIEESNLSDNDGQTGTSSGEAQNSETQMEAKVAGPEMEAEVVGPKL